MWTLDKINQYIKDGVEENLHLDYKGAGAISKKPEKKKELSKDVSAFANSDGGVIIYGVLEYNESDKKHLPEKIDPIKGQEFTKEWLEQIINSSISPRIKDIVITPIQTNNIEDNNVIYVVEIPKGITAHQSQDKRYYRRYNFESIMMDDWEIKDIINRTSKPVLEIELQAQNNKFVDRVLTKAESQIKLLMRNTGSSSVNHINCYLIIPSEHSELIESYVSLDDSFIQGSISNKIEHHIKIGGKESTIYSEFVPLLPGGVLTEIGFLAVKKKLLDLEFKIHCIVNTEYGIEEKEFKMNEIIKTPNTV